MRAQEFLLVQHPRQDPPQPCAIDERRDGPAGGIHVLRPSRVDAGQQLRYVSEAPAAVASTDPRHPLALRRLDDGRRAERQQTDERADLETRGTPVRQAQDVVVEAVRFVPHAVLADLVHGRADPQEMLGELEHQVVVAGILGCELDGDLEHVLAEHRHPRGAVGLLEVTAGGERGAAVEDADVVEAEEAAFEHVHPKAVLPIHPPGEVDEELAEGALEELDVTRARIACSMRYWKSVAHAWTGGLTSLKCHSYAGS